MASLEDELRWLGPSPGSKDGRWLAWVFAHEEILQRHQSDPEPVAEEGSEENLTN